MAGMETAAMIRRGSDGIPSYVSLLHPLLLNLSDGRKNLSNPVFWTQFSLIQLPGAKIFLAARTARGLCNSTSKLRLRSAERRSRRFGDQQLKAATISTCGFEPAVSPLGESQLIRFERRYNRMRVLARAL